jgi:DNA-binding NtrC family response regulator
MLDVCRDSRLDQASARPRSKPVAIVDDDPHSRRMLREWLESASFPCATYEAGLSLLSHDTSEFSTVCLDLHLADVAGIDVLRHLRGRDAELPVVVVSEDGDLHSAVDAMRFGAYDYVVKPVEKERLLPTIRRAVRQRALSSGVHPSRRRSSEDDPLASIVGRSAPMQELARQIGRVTDTDIEVALLGETGTGKELVARAIHYGGPRHKGPFVAINCAAIPSSLQEAELFGHERGAFTGAVATRRGSFEQANGGTLLLDELGEMSLATQASLLRALQERTIRRIGSASELPVDVRIISATSRDLKKEVEAGRFREDLYYRLVVYPIELPALRDRLSDVPLLVGHTLQSLPGGLAGRVERVDPEALEALMRYEWPGNVRELQNVIGRAAVASENGVIRLSHLPSEIRSLALPALPEKPAEQRAGFTSHEVLPESIVPLQEVERREIARALQATRGNVTWAAQLLQIGRATLYRRIRDLKIETARAEGNGHG